jgi:hypothetical protein
MSCGTHRQWNNTTKAYLKTADELTLMDSKKLAVPPSSNQQGTSRVSDATTIATSKKRSFNVSDLVLRRIQNTKGLHKLSSPWEGPFTVAKMTGPGSYRLQTLEGEDVNNSWNIDQLCRFYA